MNFPNKLQKKLAVREARAALRKLQTQSNLIDFSSNDYLGFAKSVTIFKSTHQFLMDRKFTENGATGSRLLSGNHILYKEVEAVLAAIHQTESVTIFNSGYDANLGFFASVPQRNDFILYDELIHASIRDGMQLSNAKAYKFEHNNLECLENKIKSVRTDSRISEEEIYVVTEAVFSMDGDIPDLTAMTAICKKHNALLVVDEAHALGVFGTGIIQKLQLEEAVFARIVTFGKGLGCHGAAILGSHKLQQYLVNFARSFIYTTALTPHALATIKMAYKELETSNLEDKLRENIQHFIAESNRLQLDFIKSTSAIHCCVISGNAKVKKIANQLQQKGFDVKPILSPTVLEGEERLRFCLHTYNSKEEITNVLENLVTFVS
ncbi:MAG: pyridoxal phosphate-dependent aminotransferase family protein [Flavobacteriaceae bacterium]|nr:pyridoxal phosphate-dependent aminotransferase family protein [Flavobacteriaceae bacterium]